MQSQRHGLADIDQALTEATFVVRSCWPEILKLGIYLQTHRELTFPEVSSLLELNTARCIYNETTRPDPRC
jgi:hypothetical protein